MIVERMSEIKRREGIPYLVQCEATDVAYSSLRRWKDRSLKGEPVLYRPGPKKVEPFDVGHLYEEIAALRHGRRRTRGTGELYRRHSQEISRRDLQSLIAQARRDAFGRSMEIQWRKLGLVWAMDDTQRHSLFMNNCQDLASRYKFGPVVGERLLPGPQVADRLALLFNRYGPPLFLKRDLGENLQHAAVDDLLSNAFVVLATRS
jgi:hypothetical protein